MKREDQKHTGTMKQQKGPTVTETLRLGLIHKWLISLKRTHTDKNDPLHDTNKSSKIASQLTYSWFLTSSIVHKLLVTPFILAGK